MSDHKSETTASGVRYALVQRRMWNIYGLLDWHDFFAVLHAGPVASKTIDETEASRWVFGRR